MNLSIAISAYNEGDNIKALIPEIRKVISSIVADYEIIIVDGGSKDNTEKYANEGGAIFHLQKSPGYGGALREGFAIAKGDYIVTMDADLSHEPVFIENLWNNRNKADLVIASRYISGAKSEMPWIRRFLSILLNDFYTYILSLPYKDISNSFRLYNKNILNEVKLINNGLPILQELLTKIHCKGYKILEIPFCCKIKQSRYNYSKLFNMAFSYFVTLLSMWRLRNSVDSADYDERAYNSRILPQRYWNRKRYKIIMNMIEGKEKILDVGCGTSKVIQSLSNAVGMDINHNSLRYLKRKKNNALLVEGDIKNLPFKNNYFNTVLCFELIEHIPKENFILKEIGRVLINGGTLILSTPDYSKKWWVFIEWIYKMILPGAYGIQHITRYTSHELIKMFKDSEWEIINKRYLLGMIVVFKLKRIMKK